jgi:hypothetical protein
MTKRDLIDLIQERLASGDVPNDIMGRYKYQTVSALIAIVYQEAATADNSVLGTMVLPYDLNVTCENGKYFSMLTAAPAYGPMSVKYATDSCGNTYYSRQSDDQNLFLSRIKNMSKPEFYVRGKKLIWTCNPDFDTTTVYMVPNFLDMDDNEEAVMPNSISAILTRVIELVRSTDTRPQEVVNNTSQDNTPKQTNYAQ